jgi:hypothetical protein
MDVMAEDKFRVDALTVRCTPCQTRRPLRVEIARRPCEAAFHANKEVPDEEPDCHCPLVGRCVSSR